MPVPSAALARVHAPTSVRVRGHLRRTARLALVALPAVYLLTVLTTPTGRADERSTERSHAPVGAVLTIKPAADGSLHVTGWARDADARKGKQVTAYGLVDGAIVTRATARRTATRQSAARPRFTLDVPLRNGTHSVCVGLQNIGPGLSTLLRCVDAVSSTSQALGVSTRYDPTRSAAYNARYNTYTDSQLQTRLVTRTRAESTATASAAQHSPRGAVRVTAADTPADPGSGTAAVHVAGWAVDPDFRDRRVAGSVSVDGVQSSVFVTLASKPAQLRAGAGRLGAYALSVQVPAGTHKVCVALGNVGPGAVTELPCTSVDIAAPVVAPAIGSVDPADYPAQGAAKTVVAEALRHIGQKYVWATAGPDTFDCSGLVIYSFAKAGVAVPRIAAAQAAAATPITAAQARPGDLVFYHDTTGHVFHVGIYLAPGMTVAAIDPAEGVALQAITDPTATYGSFTHG